MSTPRVLRLLRGKKSPKVPRLARVKEETRRSIPHPEGPQETPMKEVDENITVVTDFR